MKSLLNKQYFKYDRNHHSGKNAFIVALIVVLILILFQPFGIKTKSVHLKTNLFLGYFIIVFTSHITNFYLIRKFIKRRKLWTLKNEIVYTLILIIAISFFVHLFNVVFVYDMPFALFNHLWDNCF